MTSPALGVFVRPPRAGQTKTRLVPALGAEGAARLYAAFLEDLLAGCARAGLTPTLWVAGDPDEPSLLAVRGVANLHRRAQPEGDLGTRMASALERMLAGAGRAVLLGSDVPTLPPVRLRQAAAALRDAELVLGPAADGGYYLLGVRGRVPPVFDGVAWSTERVLAETRQRAEAAGVRSRCMGPWYDVDTPEDLRLLRTHLRLDPGAAPATAQVLGAQAFP